MIFQFLNTVFILSFVGTRKSTDVSFEYKKEEFYFHGTFPMGMIILQWYKRLELKLKVLDPLDFFVVFSNLSRKLNF